MVHTLLFFHICPHINSPLGHTLVTSRSEGWRCLLPFVHEAPYPPMEKVRSYMLRYKAGDYSRA